MLILVWLAKLVLIVVFAVAAVAKLRDREGARVAAIGFGAPVAAAGVLGAVLPAAELIVAAALCLPRTTRSAAIAALLLLTAFTVAIIRNLARGRRTNCHCFGQLRSSPIGWPTVARNVALAGCAAVLVAMPARPIALLLATLTPAVHVVELFVAFELLRQHGRLLARLERLEHRPPAVPPPPIPEELAVGTSAPALDHVLREADAPTGKPTVLLFVDADCAPCRALWPEMTAWERTLAGSMSLVVVASGPDRVNRRLAREHGIRYLVVQRERELGEQYRVTATPSAVLVNADGHIGSRIAIGRDEIIQSLQLNERLQSCA